MILQDELDTNVKVLRKVDFLTACFILFILFFVSINENHCSAQTVLDQTLTNPWAGGLNSCTFGQIDIDLDGKNDLMIFERFGNKVLSFINVGLPGETYYSYHPELDTLFPKMQEWAEVVDYNCDGKPDIFTYHAGGIRVFKNTSDTVLKFRCVTDMLLSFYYSGFVGILGTPVDFPVFTDLDGDGDLDILTFFGLGSYVEFHKNLSVEKYGKCDSLDFKLIDNCWGDFKESEGGNRITLNTICPDKAQPLISIQQEQKHTGSTMLALDLDGNGVKDLILGDVDFPNLISMINGATGDSAHMISVDSTFPGSEDPVRLFSFPSCSYLDIDYDGVRDLIVSPFDPSYYISENYRSVWYYKNIGTDSHPEFHLMKTGFIQDQMIDVGTNSYPVLFDINGDGLPDLFIGCYGYYDSSYYKDGILKTICTSRISYYENIGTADHPVFILNTNDFAGLSSIHQTGLFPSFGDLDGDGDADLILGNSDGSLIYLENTAGAGKSPIFANPVYHFMDVDVGNFSSPQLFDVNIDGRLDLVIGKQDGTLSCFINDGTITSPDFLLVTEKFGGIDVTNHSVSYNGYSTPCIFYDKQNMLDLIVGSEEGRLFCYQDIDQDLTGVFPEDNSLLERIVGKSISVAAGERIVPATGFISDPSFQDLIIGNFAGGLNYYSRSCLPDVINSISTTHPVQNDLGLLYPNPADNQIFIKQTKIKPCVGLLVQAFNSFGTLIYKGVFSSGKVNSINTSCFSDGLYLFSVSLITSEESSTRSVQRIIIRH